jgi:hypothetical protein
MKINLYSLFFQGKSLIGISLPQGLDFREADLFRFEKA